MSVPVGVSELPGRTFGKIQFMSDVQAGYNLLAALRELREQHGEIVTVNEADRQRPDQIFMQDQYLHHGGALAAFCTWGPPPKFTSTHDPINYGNAGDLGGPGGTVISDNARELLDGNHPRGVIGRKYGLFNTGWNFIRRERWHFNIYTWRALVLAPATTPAAPKPAPVQSPEEDEVKTLFIAQTQWSKKPAVLDTWLFDCSDVEHPTYIHMGSQAEIDLYTAIGAKVITGAQPRNLFARYRCVDKSGGIR